MKYEKFNEYTKEQKYKAVEHEIDLVTHSGTTKNDLLNIIKFLHGEVKLYEDKIERGELVEVSTIRQRLHGLAYESQECGHPQIVELDEIDDLLDELSERSVENGN